MTLRYTRSALQDIHDIATYLTERNPKAASHLISEFAKATSRLTQSPNLGAKVEGGRRRLVVENYLIYYRVDNADIAILYVRHGARKRVWADE